MCPIGRHKLIVSPRAAQIQSPMRRLLGPYAPTLAHVDFLFTVCLVPNAHTHTSSQKQPLENDFIIFNSLRPG